MRLPLLLVAVTTVIMLPPSRPVGLHAQNPQEGQHRFFSALEAAQRVTIIRRGVVFTSFEVPKGVFLSVYSDQPFDRTGGQVLLRGNATIRLRPRIEFEAGTESGRAVDIMSKAPFVLAAEDAEVRVDSLP
jgi:hypothetical protein